MRAVNVRYRGLDYCRRCGSKCLNRYHCDKLQEGARASVRLVRWALGLEPLELRHGTYTVNK